MSVPIAAPPSYNDAMHPQYNNYGFDPMNSPMSPAMIATVGRPMAGPAGSCYTDTTPNTGYSSQGYDPSGVESHTFGNSFSDKAIRRSFIKKVYMILLTQMIVTLAIIAAFISIPRVHIWIIKNIWFYYTSYGIFIITYFVLVCIPSVRRNHPGNIICLSVFTLSAAFMMGTISSFHSTTIVLIAIAVTAVVCLSISLFATQTRIDFTLYTGLLFTFVIIVLLFGLGTMITQFALQKPLPILNNVYGALLALLFAWFLVYDTQSIMGGKKIELSPEEYIFGALQLYMDIINLFLIILSLFGRSE